MKAALLYSTALLIGLSGFAAEAATTTVTYTGTVIADQENDALGVTGPGGGVFGGLPFTVTFAEDLSNGVKTNVLGNQSIAGGSSVGSSAPVSSGTLTFDGQSITVSGPFYSSQYNGTFECCGGLTGGPQQTSVSDETTAITASIAGINIPQFGSGTAIGGIDGGNLQFVPQNGNSFAIVNGSIDSVSVSGDVPSGVPEPSTWAMMLLGFAGLSFASYRARQKSLSLV